MKTLLDSPNSAAQATPVSPAETILAFPVHNCKCANCGGRGRCREESNFELKNEHFDLKDSQ